MLCSEPTGKPGGSTWLDRLRSAKGFPAAGDLDLDRFLSQNPNSPEPNRPIQNPSSDSTHPPATIPAGLAGVVSNVLSELFFIGGSGENSELSGKKFLRKQTNPRLCAATSSNNAGAGNSNSSVDADQTNKKIKKLKKKKKKKKKMIKATATAAKSPPPNLNSDSNSLIESNRGIDDDDDGDEEEENIEELNEMRGFSRSEVTVIDTSFSAWKSEKIVFRKKNLWRVRERKGKSGSFGVKKRKSSNVEQVRDLNSVEKRAKLSGSAELSLGNNGDQSVKKSSFGEGKNLNKDSREEFCRVTVDNLNPMTVSVGVNSPDKLSPDFKKRSRFSSSLKKMKRVGSSPVMLSKGVQIDRKITGKLSKNCFNEPGNK